MDTGFVKGDSDNLPTIDYDMIHNFYVENTQFLSTEIRNEKTKRSARDCYGDNAISWVQLKRENTICTVKCRLTPEHQIRKGAYNVVVIVDEAEEEIKSSDCISCSASSGGCKHGVAFLYWLLRRSMEPSVTSTECYWRASKLSQVGKLNYEYMSLEDLTEKKSNIPEVVHFKEDALNAGGNRSGVIYNFYKPLVLENFSMFQLILKFQAAHPNLVNAELFIAFCKNEMGTNMNLVEECTRDQSNSSEWFEMRFGRITASRVYEASRCTTIDGSLVEAVMGASKPLSSDDPNSPVARGIRLEKKVLHEVEKIRKIKIRKTGLLLSEEYPFFGASPDGITDNLCIEVKCPSKEKTIKNYIKNGVVENKYLFQLQMQMMFAKKRKGLFCVASPTFEIDKKVEIIDVEYCDTKMTEVLTLAAKFWKENIFNKLIKM